MSICFHPISVKVPGFSIRKIRGGVTAAKGFKAAGIYGGLRAQGEKPDLALVTCDVDAISAGAFTTNVVAAAPVVYCKKALETSKTVITTDAVVDSDVWRKMVQVAVGRSFNQITVDGDSSTNDTVIALASGLSNADRISNLDGPEASQLQSCLDADTSISYVRGIGFNNHECIRIRDT